MRYLITTESSRVSMWMSLARRCSAVKIVVSTRRMIGLMSPVGRSACRCEMFLRRRVLVFADDVEPKPSLASSSTRCDCSVFLRMSEICFSVATLVTMRCPAAG